MIVSPSVLSCDFGNLKDEIKMLNESNAEWIHIDVMDGVFVPNISFGFPILHVIKKYSSKVLDVHLMIENPGQYVHEFAQAGADIITIHYEAVTHLHRVIQQVKKANVKIGVALNPHTPVSVLEDIITEIDLVLIMSVNPGFGGQKFITHTFEKVKRLKEMITIKNLSVLIQVDGGVNAENGVELKKSGVDSIVAGSFVFNSESPLDTIKKLSSI